MCVFASGGKKAIKLKFLLSMCNKRSEKPFKIVRKMKNVSVKRIILFIKISTSHQRRESKVHNAFNTYSRQKVNLFSNLYTRTLYI